MRKIKGRKPIIYGATAIILLLFFLGPEMPLGSKMQLGPAEVCGQNCVGFKLVSKKCSGDCNPSCGAGYADSGGKVQTGPSRKVQTGTYTSRTDTWYTKLCINY